MLVLAVLSTRSSSLSLPLLFFVSFFPLWNLRGPRAQVAVSSSVSVVIGKVADFFCIVSFYFFFFTFFSIGRVSYFLYVAIDDGFRAYRAWGFFLSSS